MLTVHVDRLHNRYVGAGGGDLTRLDGLVRETLPAALEAALALAGVRSWEDVCIDRLHVRTRVAKLEADSALTEAWSASVADAVAEAMETEGVVRYPNRTTTLVDLVVSVCSGRMGRSWAWRELGLWPVGSEGRPFLAAATALLTDPTAVVPVLRELARRPGRAARFLEALPDPTVTALSRAALLAAGTSPALPAAVVGSSDGSGRIGGRALIAPWLRPLADGATEDEAAAGPLAHLPETLRRHLAGADPLSLVLRGAAEARPSVRADLAALLLVAWDPSALAVPTMADARLAAVVGWLASRAAETEGLGAAQNSQSRDTGGSGASSPGFHEEGPAPVDATPHPESGTATVPAPRSPEARAPVPDHSMYPPPQRGTESDTADPASPTDADDPEDAELSGHEEALRRRREGTTRFGGLFFLLNVLEDHGIAEGLLSDPALSGRSGRWVLHALSGLIVGAGPDDPARLGCCGLRPGDAAPDDGAPRSVGEIDALRRAADGVLSVAGKRLGLEGALSQDAIHEVVARPARVVCDPGWTQVHLPFGAVSLAVRKAGLDRDPGFLSWLGVVVRFVYE